MTKELLAEIADAQMVLVGIGKEMEETYKEMENDSFYSSLMAQAEKEEDAAAILQYLQCYYRKEPGFRKNRCLQQAGRLAGRKKLFCGVSLYG